MRCIIFANGEYGELGAYEGIFRDSDTILCADGGANYTFQLGIKPDCIIGDLDSIQPEVREYYETKAVMFKKFPPRKDFTDIQLALDLAIEWNADEIIMLGAMGKRLDHTLANLYSGIDLVRKGIKISHYSPDCRVYIINQELIIEGWPGDIVSVLALTDEVQGATEVGFEYSLTSSIMENSKPYAVSNVLAGDRGVIGIQSGILAVFHYFKRE